MEDNILSCFIDESGDFGPYDFHSPYYLVNGQTQLTKIITSVFNTLFSNVEMKKVRPADYKLFQVADLLCTMEMLNFKAEHNNFSHSEIEFFENTRLFKKNYYKKLLKKRLSQTA